METQTHWPSIWKTPTHPKEKFFLWQAYCKGLPTLKNIYKILSHTNDIWPLCNQNSETHKHILRDCFIVKQIWESLNPPPDFFSSDSNSWLLSNSRNDSCLTLQIPWQITFIYVLKNMWLARNKFFFQNIPIAIPKLTNMILDGISLM